MTDTLETLETPAPGEHPESFPYHLDPSCRVCSGFYTEDLLRLNHDILAGHTLEQVYEDFKSLYVGKHSFDKKSLEAHSAHLRAAEATKRVDAPDTFEAFSDISEPSVPTVTSKAKTGITLALDKAAQVDAPLDEYEILKVLAKDSLSDLATLNSAMDKYAGSVKMTSSLARTKDQIRSTSMQTLSKVLEMRQREFGELQIAQKVLDVLAATMKCMVKAFKKEGFKQEDVNRFRDSLQTEMQENPLIGPYLHDRI